MCISLFLITKWCNICKTSWRNSILRTYMYVNQKRSPFQSACSVSPRLRRQRAREQRYRGPTESFKIAKKLKKCTLEVSIVYFWTDNALTFAHRYNINWAEQAYFCFVSINFGINNLQILYIYGFLNAQSRSEPSCYFHIKKQTSLDYNIFKVK